MLLTPDESARLLAQIRADEVPVEVDPLLDRALLDELREFCEEHGATLPLDPDPNPC